jgi:hypothetical protein
VYKESSRLVLEKNLSRLHAARAEDRIRLERGLTENGANAFADPNEPTIRPNMAAAAAAAGPASERRRRAYTGTVDSGHRA